MAINNLNTLLANKELYPLIDRPDQLKYYLSAEEYNLILTTLQTLIDDYNYRIDGLSGVGIDSVITSSDVSTIASDQNLFTSLRTLQEIQASVIGSRSEFLSKISEDRAAEKSSFTKGVEFGTFSSGISGGRIYGTGEAELKSLRLRDWLEVPELRYNRVEVMLGDKWRAPGAGIIESVDTINKIATLKLEDGEIGAISVNDLCFGIIHSENSVENATSDFDDGKGTKFLQGFASAYFKVEEVIGADKKQFRYTLRPISGNYTKQVHPKQFMHFVAFGNTSNIDRQNSAYETRTFERFLTGVNTWEYGFQNIAAQFGNLTNLSAFGQNMSGYSIYLNNVYFSGTVQQVKAPIIIDGFWYTWNGTEWVNTGYGVTIPGTSPVWIHFTKDNITIYQNGSANYSHTGTEIHVYEGEIELSYNPTTELEPGQYRISAVGNGITAGNVTLDNIHAVTAPASNMTQDNAEIVVTATVKRLNGDNFTIAKYQNFTKTFRGEDGDIVEYVFRSWHLKTPPTPDITQYPASQDPDYIPPDWSDDGWGVSVDFPYEWRSRRVKEDGIWGKFEAPKIVGTWGKNGQDGTGYEYIFKRTALPDAPSPSPASLIPSEILTYQNPDWVPDVDELGVGWDGWTDNPVGPTRDLQYEWTCKREKRDGLWGSFTAPALWAKYSLSGDSEETVYRRTVNFLEPTPPINSIDAVQIDGYIPTDWTRSPLGVDIEYRYEWMSERHKVDEIWSKWSPAAIHNIYSVDGKDIEFIFKLTEEDEAPEIPNNDINAEGFQNEDHIPEGWDDDPLDVTIDIPYQWISKRKRVDEVWQMFSSPTKFSTYGEDGGSTEFIYKRTTNKDNVPPIPNNDPDYPGFQYPDFIPDEWDDDPLDLSESLRYMWISQRKRVNEKWEAFSTPSIFSNYALPGADGLPLEFWGEYDNTKAYPAYDYKIIAVRRDEKYYKTIAGWGEIPANSTNPLDIPQDPLPTGSKWERFGGEWSSIATGLLLTENAWIAGFQFHREVIDEETTYEIMQSQDEDLSGKKYLKLNGTTGEVSASADKVRFNPDGSGWLANGNISWDDLGNSIFKGKIESNSNGDSVLIDPAERALKLITRYNNIDYTIAKLSVSEYDDSYAPSLTMRYYDNGIIREWESVLTHNMLLMSNSNTGKTTIFTQDNLNISTTNGIFETNGNSLSLNRDKLGNQFFEVQLSDSVVAGKKIVMIKISQLPTSFIGLSSGTVWNDNGTLKIVS